MYYNVLWLWLGKRNALFIGTIFLGDLVGQVIVDIYYNDYGANLSSIELIGHSLGAHIAGFAGNYIQSTLNQSVGKIVGLDPAGPLYQFQEEDERLSPDDADLVVAIHSDAGAFGYVGSCADIDFFPNGATPPQPGCIEQLFIYLAQTCKFRIPSIII